MAQQVIVTKDQLIAARACKDSFSKSPEWDAENERLVYTDWDATVARLLETGMGVEYLGFLVAKELVPMTRDEFRAARKTQKAKV